MNSHLIVLLLIIAFPVMEIYLLLSWIADSPIVALLYLFLSMGLGYLCIKVTKVGLHEISRHRQAMSSELGMRGFLFFGKLFFIGILLIIPGYLTDIVALLVFLFARRTSTGTSQQFTEDNSSAQTVDDPNIVETTAEIINKNDSTG